MRTSTACAAALAIVAGSWLTAASAATISYTDGDFSTWTSSTIFGTVGGQSVVRQTTGGNTGPYLSVTTGTNDTTFTGFFEPTFVYNPASGAVSAISFSIDYRNIASIGQGQAVALTVSQAGSYYRAGPFVTGSSNFSWQTQPVATYTLANFVRLSGSGTLNFSTGGAPIAIGFSTGNSGGLGINVGYDNFAATVTTVPVPATLWLAASALVTLLGAGRIARSE